MHNAHFNVLAIFVITIAQWFFGALWFSPAVFMKAKQKALGTTAKPKHALAGMIVTFIASLLLTFILDHFIIWSGASNFHHGAFIGFIAWLGFIAVPTYAFSLFEDRPFIAVAIDTGYWLVCATISGGILAIWL